MPNCAHTNNTDHDQYVVYASAGGVSLEIETVSPGESWYQGALECFYDAYDDYEAAYAYVYKR
jgi:hypothetical protein